MLEIFGIVMLTKWLAGMCTTKGYTPFIAAIGPMFWIGGEASLLVAGAIAGVNELGLMCLGPIGGLCGGAVSTAIVMMLPDRMGELGGATGSDPQATKDNPFAP